MAIFDIERLRRATPARAAILLGALGLLLSPLVALPSAGAPEAPAVVAVGGVGEDPGGDCCMRGSTVGPGGDE